MNKQVVKLQEKLHSSLNKAWGLDDSQYLCYGLCSKNKTSDGYAAEIYTGNGEYQDVLWDDKASAVSFFSASDSVVIEKGQGRVDVALIFFVDLSKLKPDVTHRADEEVRTDVLKTLGYSSFGFALKGYETGVKNVLKEYPGSQRDKNLTALDMQPIHAFRINLNLIYQQN
jgi:hypothetical protein